jgi:hypothetical protein
VRLALWTPRQQSTWWSGVLAGVGREAVVALREDDGEPPEAEVHVYDVADDPAHGFVYRALLRRPGVVVLEHWCLHRLVHAETAARGDVAAYRHEARLGRGETGTFVAEQVLAGRGGALPSLVAWNERVLASALALGARSEDVEARGRARLGRRPVLRLPPDDPDAAASGLLSLARAVARDGERLLRESRTDRPREGTLLALALDELRPAALSLGLPSVPPDARDLVAALLPEER